MAEATPKEALLAISERLVDISEELDSLKESGNESAYAALHRELRTIGDRLVGFLEEVEGDDLAFTHFSLGSLCSMMGYWQNAEKSYRQALSHWPDHVGILNELFDCLMEQKKYGEARDIIEQSIRHGGETPVILQNYAVVLTHLEKTDEAKVVMFNCMAKFPEDQRSRELLAQLDGSNTN